MVLNDFAHCSLYTLSPSVTHTHTHTQRSVTHGEVSDASMDAAAELLKGGIWSFSPLSR